MQCRRLRGARRKLLSKRAPKRINSDDVVLAHTHTRRHTRSRLVCMCCNVWVSHEITIYSQTTQLSLSRSRALPLSLSLSVALTSAKTPTHVCAKPTKMPPLPPLGMLAESTQRSLSEMRTLFAQEMCSTCAVLVFLWEATQVMSNWTVPTFGFPWTVVVLLLSALNCEIPSTLCTIIIVFVRTK